MRLILFLLCFIPVTLFGQRHVSGQIIDAEDKTPIPGVTVFISNTTVGTVTDFDGSYRLTIPSKGSYELSISHVAYQSIVKPIEAGNTSMVFNIEMQSHVLDEIVVEHKVRKRQRDINLFWETILGEKPSKRKIHVTNPEAVYYYYNPDTRILTVTCRAPLHIINYQTGYQIQYILNRFTHDYNTGITDRNQQFNFTELEAANLRQKNGWEQKREELYNTSLEKFIRSLYNNSLFNDGFVLATLQRISDPDEGHKDGYMSPQAQSYTANNNKDNFFQITVLNADSLLSEVDADRGRTLTFPQEQLLLICYGRPVTNQDLNKIEVMRGRDFLESDNLIMNLLHGTSIRIFPDGTFANPLEVGPVNSSKLITTLNRRIPIDRLDL